MESPERVRAGRRLAPGDCFSFQPRGPRHCRYFYYMHHAPQCIARSLLCVYVENLAVYSAVRVLTCVVVLSNKFRKMRIGGFNKAVVWLLPDIRTMLHCHLIKCNQKFKQIEKIYTYKVVCGLAKFQAAYFNPLPIGRMLVHHKQDKKEKR